MFFETAEVFVKTSTDSPPKSYFAHGFTVRHRREIRKPLMYNTFKPESPAFRVPCVHKMLKPALIYHTKELLYNSIFSIIKPR